MRRALAAAAGLLGIVALGGGAVAAEAVPSLQGAWVESELSCDQVFSKDGGKWSLRKMDDFNVGGFIVDGDRIRGQSNACRIDRTKKNGSKITLLLSCENGVMSSTQEMFLTLMDGGTVQRNLAGFNDFAQTYKRCN